MALNYDYGGRGEYEDTTPEDLAAIVASSPTPIKPNAADLLTQQILAQNLTNKWTGEGFGSAQANAADMARILAGLDITDINQFGQITKSGVDTSVTPQYEYTENGPQIIGYVDQTGKTVDPSLVKQDTVYSGGDAGTAETIYTAPVGTATAFGNKLTGKEVPNTYGERQINNFFGGTYSGSGNTGYGVQFDKSGNPLFYTQGASSNDLKALMDDLGPIGQIGLAIATGGLSIPEQIAANMVVQVLSGQDIGDAVKNAFISYAGAQIPGLDAVKEGSSFLKGIDSTGTLSNAFQNAVVSGGKALLGGKDVGDAMIAGAVSGGTNGAVNALLSTPEFSGLTDAQKKMAANAVTGVISGKPIDQVLINTAISAANNAIKSTGVNAGKAENTSVGNFEDTEVTRLKGLGYDNKQIQSYFDKLDNISAALDNIDTEVAEPKDIVQTLSKAGLINTDEFLQSIGIKNIDDLQDSNLSNDDILRLINADIEGVTITGKKETQDQDVLDRSLGQKTTDQGTMTITGQRPTDEGNITITGDRPTDIGGVEVVDKKESNNLNTKLSCPEGYEPNEDGTACVPVIEIKDKKDTQTLSCPEGYEPNADGTACIPVIEIKDKKCAEGFVYDEDLQQCVPITKEPLTCPTGFHLSADGLSCVKDETVVKPPVVNPPGVVTQPPVVKRPVVLPDFTPSTYTSLENTDPIYAQAADEFNLFATLQDLLAEDADKDKKKDNKKSRDKTKMASGGHLDDLLAEQMTVDDLLKLLR